MFRALAVLAVFAAAAAANDWPQWLGPNRDMSNQESGLLKQWPEGGPTKLWSFDDCGEGYSGPAVVDGRLYLMGVRNGEASLIVLDVATGQELWSKSLATEFNNAWGDGPRGTPTVDGDRVYCLTANGTLACLSTTNGKSVWSTTMEQLGGKVPTWGYSESPLIDGNLVLVTPGGEQGAIAALDKHSGKLVWQSTDASGTAHYSSIMPTIIHGQPQYVQLLMERAVGISREDGSLLWETPWPGRVAVIPTPLLFDNQVYLTSGYGVGCKLVAIAPGNEVSEVYANKVMKNHHGGVIAIDGHIYGYSDKVGWLCQNLATGERVWREREALGKGGLGYADGMLYLISEDSGEVVLLNPTPKGWDERGRFILTPQTKIRKDRGRIWTHPVVVDGKLYLRDQDLLHVYDVRAE